MRKIYIIPNFVTTVNMGCGFFSIVASMQSDFVSAAWAIFVAAIFDALDGRIARLAKATSQFGLEYDSLSDLTSFGIAPAALLYQWALVPYGRLGWLAAFLFVACSALRLARFNINTAIIPKGYFQGLPTPMSANIIGMFIVFNSVVGWPDSSSGGLITRENVVLFLTFGLSSLMVSNVRFPSFKELNWRSRGSFGYFLVAVLAMILIAVKPEVTLFLLLTTYLVLSLVWNLVRVVLRGSYPKEQIESVGYQSKQDPLRRQ